MASILWNLSTKHIANQETCNTCEEISMTRYAVLICAPVEYMLHIFMNTIYVCVHNMDIELLRQLNGWVESKLYKGSPV